MAAPQSRRRSASRPTRAALIATAERLFSERGVDAVSLAEIIRSAGQRNASALQYHFGGKEGLIRAILAKHQPGIERSRQELLGELAPADTGSAGLRSLMAALVRPLAAKLEDPDGGVAYLRLMAQLIGNPAQPYLREGAREVRSGRNRLMREVEAALPGIPPQLGRLRAQMVGSLLFHALSDGARLIEAGLLREADRGLFVENLIDTLAAVLQAPVSPESAALA